MKTRALAVKRHACTWASTTNVENLMGKGLSEVGSVLTPKLSREEIEMSPGETKKIAVLRSEKCLIAAASWATIGGIKKNTRTRKGGPRKLPPKA